MKVSQLKEEIRKILRSKLQTEAQYNIGKLKFMNKSLSDDKILDIAREYQQTSSTKFNRERDFQINAFHDLTFLLGLSSSPEQFVKTKWNIVRNAPLFKMFKDGKIPRDEYKQLYSDLKRKTLSSFRGLVNSMYRVGLNKQASAQARKDMKSAFGESVNEAKTYKKGDKLKIKLPNGKKFDVVFDAYSRTKGVALGKFKDGSGEYDTKPFNLDTIVESVINEDTRRVKLLGIDFKISEMNGRIFFSFVDKKAASVSLRQVGTNKIVNHIQKRLDIAYGKGTFFFKSGDHAEFQNGYLFQRNTADINLNKLKFESVINEAIESEIINQLRGIVKNKQSEVLKDPNSGKKIRVDMQSANTTLKIYDGLSSSNKATMVKMGLPKMMDVAFKISSKYNK